MDKYYVPSIEEFHVGFECEIRMIQDPNGIWNFCKEGNYKKYIVVASNIYVISTIINENDYIRVKYLDKQDIEECGFIYDNELKFPNGSYKSTVVEFLKNEYCLSRIDVNEIMISKYIDGVFDKLFIGVIKNKSELKRVLKMIGIDE